MTKLKGRNPKKVNLVSINPLDREFEYNDSIWAWSKVDETAKCEELRDIYNKKR